MQKLNFGCGDRFAEGWVNIDFHSSDRRVKRVNLLPGYEKKGHETEFFREKFKQLLESGDPFYNRNLTLEHEDFRYADVTCGEVYGMTDRHSETGLWNYWVS